MHDDPHRPRFFAYLSLFTFAMLMLVTADNLVQMFFGWEGVGLASYLLIGFWYKKPSANAAAIKAFIVNRVGDFGFALGIFLVFVLFGSVNFEQIFPKARRGRRRRRSTSSAMTGTRSTHHLPAAVHGRHGQVGAVPAAHLAAGRDGGPDAGLRADPRRDDGDRRRLHGGALSPLFELSHVALAVVMFIGATTAFFAGTVGLVQNDIKRVIAYSTCSQLGYMFVALGVGRLWRWHLPPVHARLLQGAAVPRRGLGHPRHAPRAGHAPHGRADPQDPVHHGDDGDRHAGADGLSADGRLFLEGRDHRGGLCARTSRATATPSSCW